MSVPILEFDVGELKNSAKPKNYIEKLILERGCEKVQEFLEGVSLSEAEQEDLHTFWTVSGHRVRKKIDNDSYLERLLKGHLPKYKGGRITLYRGENKERYKAQKIGFCWTCDREVAAMFARGLNARDSGGLLLKASFEEAQIIAGPSGHSIYLGEKEYTVLPSAINFCEIKIIEEFEPVQIIDG